MPSIDVQPPRIEECPVQMEGFCRFFGVGGEVHASRLAKSNFMDFVRNGTGPRPTQLTRGTDR
jgi:hypothetical protein